jgi:hypothetical protein
VSTIEVDRAVMLFFHNSNNTLQIVKRAKSTTTRESGWFDFKPLKGGEKSKDTSVPVALPQGTTER